MKIPSTPLEARARDRALVALGSWLRSTGYRFVTPTPSTHARVNARAGAALASDLRGVFGWSRPFEPSLLPEPILGLMHEAAVVEAHGALLRSQVRFSSLAGALFVHSAYPTVAADSVFFGPDTYRFVAWMQREQERLPPSRSLCEIGCGSGAAGLVLAQRSPGCSVQLTDINPRALEYAAVNAQLVEIPCELAESDVLRGVRGSFDRILANPPYMIDEAARAYRHGGGEHGTELSLRIVREALPRLEPGGVLWLYTGAPIVSGVDRFLHAVSPLLEHASWRWSYQELDPDVFGEELETPGYAEVERIAVVGLSVHRLEKSV